MKTKILRWIDDDKEMYMKRETGMYVLPKNVNLEDVNLVQLKNEDMVIAFECGYFEALRKFEEFIENEMI